MNTSTETQMEEKKEGENNIVVEESTKVSNKKPYVMTDKRKEVLAKANKVRKEKYDYERTLQARRESIILDVHKIYEEKLAEFKTLEMSKDKKNIEEKAIPIEKVKVTREESDESSEEEVPVKVKRNKGQKPIKIERKSKYKHSRRKREIVQSESSDSSDESDSVCSSSSEEEVQVKRKSKSRNLKGYKHRDIEHVPRSAENIRRPSPYYAQSTGNMSRAFF